MEPFTIGAAAITAGAALAGQGAQAIGTSVRNKKQFKRTQQLMDKQYGQNQQMALFNQEQQMKMWEATGPTGQMEQLRKAGLNPGLIYGMKGGGGQTAQAAQGSPVSGGNADVENAMHGASGMGLMLGQQIALIDAQRKNIEADTANKLGDAANKPLVGENLEANTALTKIKTDLETTAAQVAEMTKWQAMGTIQKTMEKVSNEVDLQVRQKFITAETQQTVIDQTKTTLVGAYLQNELTRINTDKSKEEIKQISNNIAQKWKELELKGKEIGIREFEAEIRANYPGISQAIGRDINEGLRDLWDILGVSRKSVESMKK